MTKTEEFVANLCTTSFLPFWSFPNPIGKKNDKELCDILVVCDPDIVIFSVKEINIKDSGNHDLDIDRWERKAIEESVNQIYGAERILQQKEEVLLKDKSTKIKLPKKEVRNIYRVAVTFGRGEKFPLKLGDFGKGFVHVYDERSIQIILEEMDTVTDFINFLKAQEKFSRKQIHQIAFSGEDYLGLYLNNGFDIQEELDLIILDNDYWNGFSKSEKYLSEKKEDEISYLWDGIVHQLYTDYKNDNLIEAVSHEELEVALRLMNRESRFGRRQLSKAMIEALGDGTGKANLKSRIFCGEYEDSPLYVILPRLQEDRDFKRKELHLRCLVAKSLFNNKTKVIGLATEAFQKGKGYTLDLCYLDLTHWSKEQQIEAETIKEDLGYFKSSNKSRLTPSGQKVDF